METIKQMLSNGILQKIIAGVAILLVLIIIIAFFASNFFKPADDRSQEQPLELSSPTPINSSGEISITPTRTPSASPNKIDVENSDTYRKSIEQIDEDQKDFSNQEAAVGQLIHKLPYLGKNFSMSYVFDSNQFQVQISNSAKALGDQEFVTFLKNNGIDSQTWIRNLVISYY